MVLPLGIIAAAVAVKATAGAIGYFGYRYRKIHGHFPFMGNNHRKESIVSETEERARAAEKYHFDLEKGPYSVVAITIDPSDEEAPASYSTVESDIRSLEAACDLAKDRAKGSDHMLLTTFEVRDRHNFRRKRDGSIY